ncbi:MAG: DEAD/DEAH box helicase family protein [Candidatus Muirbacterium halophilum]|nr:DEAD/DEAH box helicase family protein [Candidatus Muirbacterium halophilum]
MNIDDLEFAINHDLFGQTGIIYYNKKILFEQELNNYENDYINEHLKVILLNNYSDWYKHYSANNKITSNLEALYNLSTQYSQELQQRKIEENTIKTIDLVKTTIPIIKKDIVDEVQLKKEKPQKYNFDKEIDYLDVKYTNIEKLENNINALSLIKSLDLDYKQATSLSNEELKKLSNFTGWGGIQNAFYSNLSNDRIRENGKFGELKENLPQLLIGDEYAIARSTVLDSFYTPAYVAQGIWDKIENMGFAGGRILEPSVGSGIFLQTMPQKLYDSSSIDCVDIDKNCCIISKHLAPKANVYNLPFEKFEIEKEYDLVISNPPYGSSKIDGLTIHNYFIKKSLDSLKEGGIMGIVITNSFLDSKNIDTKIDISKSADLLGAVRLPSTAFKDNAKTEVITDVIFFRKRFRNEIKLIDDDKNFINNAGIKKVETEFNEYFVNNQDMIIGQWQDTTSQFGIKGTVEFDDTKDIKKEVDRAFTKINDTHLNRKIFDYLDLDNEQLNQDKKQGFDVNIKVGHTALIDNKIIMRVDDVNEEKRYLVVNNNLRDSSALNYQSQLDIADCLENLKNLQLQLDKNDNTEIEKERTKLNKLYDKYVKDFGYLNKSTNKRLFSNDSRSISLLVLEEDYKNETIEQSSTNKTRSIKKESAKKAPIFMTRTQYPFLMPDKADNLEDAINISLNIKGKVDLNLISELRDSSKDIIIKEAEDKKLLYKYNDIWITKEEFLSGDVKTKHENEINLNYKKDLFNILPKDVQITDIAFEFGSNWIPNKYYEKFLTKITGDNDTSVHYDKFSSSFNAYFRAKDYAELTYATKRKNLKSIVMAGFNMSELKVYDKIDDKEVFNEIETSNANNKLTQIKQEFETFILGDREARNELETIYNNLFNREVIRKYDGGHLTFQGKVDDDIIELRPHQKNAVYRMVQDRKVYLDHTVGTGKTFTAIAGIMEMKRLGIINKALIATPKTVVEQFGKDFMKLYPNAKILVANENDFTKENRKKLFMKMSVDNYDAIIIGHSQLNKINNPQNLEQDMINETVELLDEQIVTINDDGEMQYNVKKQTIKQLEKQKKDLLVKLDKLVNAIPKDDEIYIDKIGIDFITIDEAHLYKNLQFISKLNNVRGMGNPKGSNKAWDFYIKTQYFNRNFDGKNIALLSGTPISNSLVELYTIGKYINYKDLEKKGILHLDNWIRQFAKVEKTWELSPTGKHKLVNRLSRYKNLPELMNMYKSTADIITRQQMISDMKLVGKELNIPKLKNNAHTFVINDKNDQQKQFLGEPDEYGKYPKHSLIGRSENITYPLKKGDDNMLSITTDAKKASIDMRLINSELPDSEDNKINQLINKAITKYYEFDYFKGTQLIFSDIGTPKKSNEKERIKYLELLAITEDLQSTEEMVEKAYEEIEKMDTRSFEINFDIYNNIKANLINKGIPENQIAFIHDYDTQIKQLELFRDVNDGKIRFLLGSTPKLGAGVNVQNRLVALHHLDIPWKPSDLEQREGRIIRQGNLIATMFNQFNDSLQETDPELKKEKTREFAQTVENLNINIDNFIEHHRENKNFEIEIFRYAIKDTLDENLWDIIKKKAEFIEQIKLSCSEREIEDDNELESMSSAKMKALSSGNPLFLEQLKLNEKLKELDNLKKSYFNNLIRLEDTLHKNLNIIDNYDQKYEIAKNHKIQYEIYDNLVEANQKSIAENEKNITEISNKIFYFKVQKDDDVIEHLKHNINLFENNLFNNKNDKLSKNSLEKYSEILKNLEDDNMYLTTRGEMNHYFSILSKIKKDMVVGYFGNMKLEIEFNGKTDITAEDLKHYNSNLFKEANVSLFIKIPNGDTKEIQTDASSLSNIATPNRLHRELNFLSHEIIHVEEKYQNAIAENKFVEEELKKGFNKENELLAVKQRLNEVEQELTGGNKNRKNHAM